MNARTLDQQPSEETTIVSKSIHFIDINRSFAEAAINRLAEQGTTRAEFMAMLTRLILNDDQILKAHNQSLTFSDIVKSGCQCSV